MSAIEAVEAYLNARARMAFDHDIIHDLNFNGAHVKLRASDLRELLEECRSAALKNGVQPH